MIVSSLLIYGSGYTKSLDDATIEMEARKRGMIYRDEITIQIKEGVDESE